VGTVSGEQLREGLEGDLGRVLGLGVGHRVRSL
jgi:hypothetical protein